MTNPPAKARHRAPWADGVCRSGPSGLRLLTWRCLVGIIDLAGSSVPGRRSEVRPELPVAQRVGSGQDQYGGLVMIYGTLMTSFIALLIAVPVSFGIALFLTELSPNWLKRPLGVGHRTARRGAVHRLRHVGPAGVRPDPATYVQQPLQAALAGCPCWARFFGPAGGHRHPVGRHHPGHHGHPVHRLGDARRVRGHAAMLKESAYGLGSTTWEVVSKVVLPYTKTGVVGGIMLGLGRALGETMAVTFVIGNFNQLDSLSLFEAANSITSALANEFAEAGEGLHQASLIYLGWSCSSSPFVVLACPSCCCRVSSATKEPLMSVAIALMPRVWRAPPRASGECVALTLSLAAMAFGLFWLVWILFRDGAAGHRRPDLAGLHRDDAAAAGRDRWPGQRHLRLAGDGGLATCARHAHRRDGRHLPGRVRPEGLAGQRHPLHQRHPAVGTVDRDRPVHLLAVVVARIQVFSAWAGVLALALIVIPVVIRTTENMLRLIPNALREAAYALGTPKWKVILSITLKAARPVA
jgi:phosphate transport system permease protein